MRLAQLYYAHTLIKPGEERGHQRVGEVLSNLLEQ